MNAVFTPQRFLIDVDQLLHMDEAGIFPPEARIEVIEGELLIMAPIGLAYEWAVNQLNRSLLHSEAWIVNLPERRIECYTDPHEGSYRQHRVIWPDEPATTPAIPALSLPWAEALPIES
jgi:hypothetical protein